MEISVLVEKVADNGYRARGAEPFGFTAEATTRLRRFKNSVRRVSMAARKS